MYGSEKCRNQLDCFRLNRAIAQTGFTSRRNADKLIQSGRVKVNGAVIRDFNHVVNLEQDKICIDGKLLSRKELKYVAIHKPKGIITTLSDERGRRCIIDLLPKELRHLRPVGRLDCDSEGLLLLTNDGELAQKLTHPSHQTYKIYRVTVKGSLTRQAVKSLASGVKLKESMTSPCKVCLIRNNDTQSVVEITMSEGHNRQIRRMCAKLGLPVVRLVRVAIGGLQLGQMKASQWRFLTKDELYDLKKERRGSDIYSNHSGECTKEWKDSEVRRCEKRRQRKLPERISWI